MVLRIDHIGSSPIFLGSAHKCKELITQLSEHNVRAEIVKPADYITVKRFLSFTDWLMEFVSYHAAFKALATKEFQSTYGENYANNQHFLSDGITQVFSINCAIELESERKKERKKVECTNILSLVSLFLKFIDLG